MLCSVNALLRSDARLNGDLGVARAFRAAGGVRILENLQRSFCHATYRKTSSMLLHHYIDIVEVEDEEDAAADDFFFGGVTEYQKNYTISTNLSS